MTAITEPGVYDLSDHAYHADPVPGGSLSASGAKLLLPPSCPAKFAHARAHGRPPKREFDLGHAAHREVLGVGADVEIVDAPDWRTKAARQARDKARTDGATPILAHEWQQVQAMAAALSQHPIAAVLFDPERGRAEQSLFWQDRSTGVWCRARFDFLPHPGEGRLVIPDYKTADSADPEVFARAAARYGYHIQAAWYKTAARALGLSQSTAFVFVVQEKTPPYLVTVVELDLRAEQAGAAAMRHAMEIYRDCAESGVWPAYTQPDEIPLISLPAYATRDPEETW